MNRFYLPLSLREYTQHSLPYVDGHYVYAWLDTTNIFYVGMGTNRRAWNNHLPLPEKYRDAATNFWVRILAHGLTKTQAHGMERYYITLYSPPANTRKPKCMNRTP